MLKNQHALLGALLGMLAFLTLTKRGQNLATTIGTGIIDMTQPRGIRNNNPGNIRYTGEQWQGMSATQTDPSFIQFISPEYGIRALAIDLRSKLNRGLSSIQEIISVYAPPAENDTAAYINAVSKTLDKSPADALTSADIPGLVQAIIIHENGIQPYDLSTLNAAFNMAGTPTLNTLA